jgi:hypothetical protein
MPIRGDRLRWPPRPGKRAGGSRAIGTRETLSTDEQKPAPRQPNERDQSADSQASAPRDVIRRAHDDVTAGRKDTDCRNRAAEIVERNQTKRRRTP